VHHGKNRPPMSHKGQHRTWRLRFVMSVLTQQADIDRRLSQVCFGPYVDIKVALSGSSPLCYAASDAMMLIIVRFLVRLTSLYCFGIDYWLEVFGGSEHAIIFREDT